MIPDDHVNLTEKFKISCRDQGVCNNELGRNWNSTKWRLFNSLTENHFFFFTKILIRIFRINHLLKIWNAKHAKHFLTLQRVSWLNLSLLSKPTQTNTLANFFGFQWANYFLKSKTFTMPYYLASWNWKLWILHTEMEGCSA